MGTCNVYLQLLWGLQSSEGQKQKYNYSIYFLLFLGLEQSMNSSSKRQRVAKMLNSQSPFHRVAEHHLWRPTKLNMASKDCCFFSGKVGISPLKNDMRSIEWPTLTKKQKVSPLFLSLKWRKHRQFSFLAGLIPLLPYSVCSNETFYLRFSKTKLVEIVLFCRFMRNIF